VPLYDHPIVIVGGGGMHGSEPGGDLTFVGREFCSGGDCVEVARLADGRVALRSSLAPDASPFVVTSEEWAQFLRAAKSGCFDGV
jgi:Domain of unknown function (DUF397)